VKNTRSRLKRQAVVLAPVDPVLFIVPFKPHRYTKCITHNGELRSDSGPFSESRVIRTEQHGKRSQADLSVPISRTSFSESVVRALR
jgi:hypothetical protein